MIVMLIRTCTLVRRRERVTRDNHHTFRFRHRTPQMNRMVTLDTYSCRGPPSTLLLYLRDVSSRCKLPPPKFTHETTQYHIGLGDAGVQDPWCVQDPRR